MCWIWLAESSAVLVNTVQKLTRKHDAKRRKQNANFSENRKLWLVNKQKKYIRTNQLPQSTGGKLADALKNCRPTKLILVVSPQKIPLKNWKKSTFKNENTVKRTLYWVDVWNNFAKEEGFSAQKFRFTSNTTSTNRSTECFYAKIHE